MKKIRYTTLLVLVVLMAACDTEEVRKQRFLLQGNEAIAQQDYREAAHYYNEAIALDSCYIHALNNLGVLYFKQRQYGKAVYQYDMALNCAPDFYKACLNRVNAYYELKEYYRALDDLTFLQRNLPDTAIVYFTEGLVKTKLRQYPEAVNAFDKAYALDSTSTETLINRGTVKYYMGALEAAEKDMKTALKLRPFEGHAFNTLSLIEIDKGNYDKALELVNKALDFDPGEPYFLNNRGYIYLLQGKLALAREDIDRSIVFDPNNGWAYRNKGRYYYLDGKYEDAVSVLEKTVKMDGFIDKAYLFLGEAYAGMGKDEKACAAWKVAMERKEKGAEMLWEKCEGS